MRYRFFEWLKKAYKLNIGCIDSNSISIIEFNASDVGENTSASIKVLGNVYSRASLYIAVYEKSGKLLELQRPVISDGTANAAFSSENIDKLKVFIWSGNIKPLCRSKEIKIN